MIGQATLRTMAMNVIVSMNVRMARKPEPKTRRRRTRVQISDRLKREIAVKYGCRRGETTTAKCAYCEATGSVQWLTHTPAAVGYVTFPGLHIEHVIPQSRGGKTAVENLVLACRTCNLDKGNRTPEEWSMAR